MKTTFTILLFVLLLAGCKDSSKEQDEAARRKADAIRQFEEIKRMAELKKRAKERQLQADREAKSKQKLADKEKQKEKINNIIAELNKKAEKLAEKKEYQKAVEVYRNYSGEYAEDIKSKIKKYIEKYSVLAKEKSKADAILNEKRREIVDAVSPLLFKSKNNSALKKFHSFKNDDAFKDILEILTQIDNAEEHILARFNKDIGKKITLKTKNKNIKVKIKKVKGKTIYCEESKGVVKVSKKVNLDDLSLKEKMRQLRDINEIAKAIYIGTEAVKEKDLKLAEKCFADAGPFTDNFLDQLESVKQELEEREEQASENDVPEKEKKDISTPVKQELNPHHFEIKVIINRQKRQARVTLNNRNSAEMDSFSMALYLIGQSVNNRKSFCLAQDFKRNFSFKPKQTFTYPEIECGNLFDNNSYKYYGYIIIIRDGKGKIFKTKTTRSKLEHICDELDKMQKGKVFDLKGMR